MNPRLAPWAIIYRASRRSTRAEQAAEFEKRKLCATPLRAQRRHAAATRAWQVSSQPVWLDKATYVKKIQPLLSAVTVPVLASALGISEPYAAEIRAGRYLPHPRHWQTLAHLVGVSPDK